MLKLCESGIGCVITRFYWSGSISSCFLFRNRLEKARNVSWRPLSSWWAVLDDTPRADCQESALYCPPFWNLASVTVDPILGLSNFLFMVVLRSWPVGCRKLIMISSCLVVQESARESAERELAATQQLVKRHNILTLSVIFNYRSECKAGSFAVYPLVPTFLMRWFTCCLIACHISYESYLCFGSAIKFSTTFAYVWNSFLILSHTPCSLLFIHCAAHISSRFILHTCLESPYL